MKIRFYCDVPEWQWKDMALFAYTAPMSHPPTFKRIAFDVDFPPDVLKVDDGKAVARVLGVVDGAEK